MNSHYVAVDFGHIVLTHTHHFSIDMARASAVRLSLNEKIVELLFCSFASLAADIGNVYTKQPRHETKPKHFLWLRDQIEYIGKTYMNLQYRPVWHL